MQPCRTRPAAPATHAPTRRGGSRSSRSSPRPRRSSSRPGCAGSTSSRPAPPIGTGWKSTSTSTRSTTRTSTRATTGRSSTSTTTTCSSCCTSRSSRRRPSRMLTAELDLFMGPDYLITLPNIPLPPLNAMFERYREKDDLRAGDPVEGLRLPALQDRRHLRRRLVPDAPQDGGEARPDRGRHLRGPIVARSSATSPRRSRRSSTSAGSRARSARSCATSSGRSSAISRRSSRSTSTTSPTPPSGSGTPSRTTRRSSRRSSRRTSRCFRTA